MADKIIDLIVDRCWILVGILILVSVFMVFLAPDLEIDPELETIYDPSSPEYGIYRKFVDTFGNDEFILVAIKSKLKATDPVILKSVESLTKELQNLDKVIKVDSFTNLLFPEQRVGTFGLYPLVKKRNGQLALEENDLKRLRKKWPSIDMLVSRDLKTVGLLASIVDELTFGPWTVKLLKDMELAVKRNFPTDSKLHMIGMPVMKVALQKYTAETARTFGLLSALIATLISLYIFKRLWVMLAGCVVGGLSVLWIVGFMVLLDIRLNMSTSVCFGIIFILTIPTVIHIVSHFNKQYRKLGEKTETVKAALRIVARPCLMCSLTTSIGFASILLSPIPSISQMGMILSLGVLFSFVLTIVLIPTMLLIITPLSDRAYSQMSGDWLSLIYKWFGDFVFERYRILMTVSLIFIGIMITGIHFIRADEPVTHMLSDWTPESRDIRFVEENLQPFNTISIMVEGSENAFKKADAWMKVRSLEENLIKIPGVYQTRSLVPLLKNLYTLLSGSDSGSEELFRKAHIIPQILDIASLTPEVKNLLAEHVKERYSLFRMTVNLIVEPSTHLTATIEKIEEMAGAELKGLGNVSVTGHLALGAAQAMTLIRTQILSLLLALFVITLLITIQLRSIPLGLVSIIPNALPLVVIFGVMGWFGIYLDSLTIFVAVISYGLSVDDTIHYLTQLKREMRSGKGSTKLRKSLFRAYQVTGKALISTSAVLCFSFLALSISPFSPVVSFGILASLAVGFALAGDIMFLPSIALSSARVRKVLKRGLTVDTEDSEDLT